MTSAYRTFWLRSSGGESLLDSSSLTRSDSTRALLSRPGSAAFAKRALLWALARWERLARRHESQSLSWPPFSAHPTSLVWHVGQVAVDTAPKAAIIEVIRGMLIGWMRFGALERPSDTR